MAAEMCVTENMQRMDLSPLEEAEGVKALLDTGHTQQDVADRIGKTRQWVARRANLLNLCPLAKEAFGDTDCTFSLCPIEGLELISALPENVQVEVVTRYSEDCCAPVIGDIKRCIEALMHELKDAPFSVKDCSECPKRTGVQPDLFEGRETCPLGRCLDADCWNLKRKTSVEVLLRDIDRNDPGTVVFSDDYGLRSEVAGIRAEYDVTVCKKEDHGAVQAFKLDSFGNAKKVWIKSRQPMLGESDEKTRQPTLDEKRMAYVCRYVSDLIEKANPNPLRSFSFEKIAKTVNVTGTSFSNNQRDSEEWSSDVDTDSAGIGDELWDRVKPVLESRIKYVTITGCKEYYYEAVAQAKWFFNIDRETLDAEAAESVPVKSQKGK
jgi:hypothetical protein